jgi:prepilin-type N-terminal cleavage/methylation domain-containing protein/prepilin-type processing-associated H-X9-DG protein
LDFAVRCAKTQRPAGGFTMVELLVVIAIIGLLAALLLPALTGSKQRAKRIVCESQLRQAGVAFQMFSHDHNSKFPMQVAVADGGSEEFVQGASLTNGLFYIAYRNFVPLAGLLETPTVLVCPADTRPPAASFTTFQNSNLSYFVGVNASYDQPMSILAGDGNLAASATMVHAAAGGRLTWNSQLHVFKGNVLFSDGHVEEWNDTGVGSVSSRSDIILPTVGGSGRGSSSGSGSLGTAQSNPGGAATSPGGGANSASQTAGATAPAGTSLAASQSGNPNPSPSQPMTITSSERQNMTTAAAGQNVDETSNAAAADAVVDTNVAAVKASGSNDDTTATMSPTNRKVASVLGGFLFGTYVLILLAVLAYAGYRFWRWRQEEERKRRRKMAQARTSYDA